MKDMEKSLKMHFEDEIAGKSIPPFKMPVDEKAVTKRRARRDSILLAACALGCLFLFTRPDIYDTRIRKTYVHKKHIETFKETVPKVLFTGIQYMKDNKGDREK